MNLIVLISVALAASSLVIVADADDRKSASNIIRSRGFDVDEFDVISQNYVLKVYRIINPLADPKKLHKIPIVCNHGISFDMSSMMASSRNSRPRKPKLDERVTLYAMENGTDDRGIHFYFSNNNYDVWLLEARAVNPQSSHRLSDGGNDKAFWDFSIDEQALLDLPTQIEFVLAKTGAPKVAYVAYSQSTVFMFALLSMRPDFSKKLACFVAMAPVVFTAHIKGIIWPMTSADILAHSSVANPRMPSKLRKLQNFIVTYMCSISFIRESLCRAIWNQFAGPTKHANMDGGMVENVLKSTSLKTFEQFMDNGRLHDFRMYDYKDETRNMEEYGQPVPPQYNVSKINLRTISLFRGNNDYLSTPEDQMTLLSRLRVPLYEDHILEEYSHIDFITSPTVTRDVNEPTLRIIDKITERPVNRTSHTLGNPNPQVEGTKLVMDVKEEHAQVNSSIRSKVAGNAGGFQSQSNSEKPPADGVINNPNATTIKEQLRVD